MRVLVGKCFGIGNAVLSIPMIKALSTVAKVDVLIGMTPDDAGARSIFRRLKASSDCIENIYLNAAPLDVMYDYAVMSMPFDGRWQNGQHFTAQHVIDERRRPDNVPELGFHMWKRHEVDYQMDNAVYLGYNGTEVPSMRFFPKENSDVDLVYIGIGHKRDPGGFGASKHFGNDNFIQFIKEMKKLNPHLRFISTGSSEDYMESGVQIMREIGDPGVYECFLEGIDQSLNRITKCDSYFGNDTGMMHVAASLGMYTYGMTPYEGLLIKNPPYCKNGRMRLFGPPAGEIAADFNNFMRGK